MLSSIDSATAAASELTQALLYSAPAAPFANTGDEQMLALNKLVHIFKQSTETKAMQQKTPTLTHFRGYHNTSLLSYALCLHYLLQPLKATTHIWYR